MDSKFINAITEDEFRATAYHEYVKDCNEQYANMIACITDVIGDTPEDDLPEGQVQLTHEEVIEFVESKLLQYGYAGSESVALPRGYTNLKDLCVNLFEKFAKYSDTEDDTGFAAISNYSINLTDIDGVQADEPMSALEIVDALKEQYHASIVLESAMLASKFESAVDRLSVFKDNIETKFSNVYADISNSVEYFKGIISDGAARSRDVISSLFSVIGTDDQNTVQGYVPDVSDVSQYTGANPIATLDFSAARKLVSATAKIVAGAVASAAKAVWSVGKKVFNWAYKKVYNTVVNPYDIEVINSDTFNKTIDGFQVQQEWPLNTGIFSMELSASYFTPTQSVLIADSMSSMVNRWIKYDTIFGEILFRFDSIQYRSGHTGVTLDFGAPLCKIKLKPVNRMAIKKAFDQMFYEDFPTATTLPQFVCGVNTQRPNHGSLVNCYFFFNLLEDISLPGGTTTRLSDKNLAKWLDYIPLQDDFSPDINDVSEQDMYLAYATSWAMLASIINWSNFTPVYSATHGCYIPRSYAYNAPQQFVHDSNVTEYFMYDDELYHENGLSVYIDVSDVPSTITNADFLNLACGYNPINGSFSFDNIGLNSVGRAVNGIRFGDGPEVYIAGILINMLAMQRGDRLIHPSDYAFVAYSDNLTNFGPSRFGLRTDEQNQQALTRFLTACVLVVVAAAVAIRSVVLIKKIKRARYFKRAEYVGMQDNRMWNSDKPGYTPMTDKERRKYVRYARKINSSNLLTSGLQETASNSFSTLFAGPETDDSVSLDILRTITG